MNKFKVGDEIEPINNPYGPYTGIILNINKDNDYNHYSVLWNDFGEGFLSKVAITNYKLTEESKNRAEILRLLGIKDE